MADTMLYKAGPIQPICLAGDVVGIWTQKVWRFGKVTLVEGIPLGSPLVQNLGAVAAGQSTQPAQITSIAMNDYEFGQFRMRVLDDFAAELYLARADKRYATKAVNSRVTLFSDQFDNVFNMTEFYVHEDAMPFVAAFNETGYALAATRVAFWGFRYAYEAFPTSGANAITIKNPPPVFTRIPAQAF